MCSGNTPLLRIHTHDYIERRTYDIGMQYEILISTKMICRRWVANEFQIYMIIKYFNCVKHSCFIVIKVLKYTIVFFFLVSFLQKLIKMRSYFGIKKDKIISAIKSYTARILYNFFFTSGHFAANISKRLNVKWVRTHLTRLNYSIRWCSIGNIVNILCYKIASLNLIWASKLIKKETFSKMWHLSAICIGSCITVFCWL